LVTGKLTAGGTGICDVLHPIKEHYSEP
jgi:hypothetical protein